jgi:hypothetical protein
MSQLSVCYLFAALSKLNPGFLSGEALQSYVSVRVDLPGPLWAVLAVGAVLTELGLSVALWLPRTRWLAGLAGVLLHLTILVAMWSDAWALTAFAVACLSQYPMFFAARPAVPVTTGSGVPVRSAPVPTPRGAPA